VIFPTQRYLVSVAEFGLGGGRGMVFNTHESTKDTRLGVVLRCAIDGGPCERVWVEMSLTVWDRVGLGLWVGG